MSIANKILETEEQIAELKRQGQIEIAQLQHDLLDKQHQMKQMFQEEFDEKRKVLEEELAQTLSEYKQQKDEEIKNYKLHLSQDFSRRKDRILHNLCENFWKG